jgi:hypothetical protein
MALGDITMYSKDNGTGYPGDVNYVVVTASTTPTILSGEPVTRAAGAAYPTALASGTGNASFYPVISTGPVAFQPILGVAASTSNEATSGAVNGSVSVTPIDEPITYLISTLATAQFFGNPATSQITYDQTVGYRTTFSRVGGVGASQLGGTYYINASDASAGGLIVESLDITKYPGKVRFSFRNSLSYRT